MSEVQLVVFHDVGDVLRPASEHPNENPKPENRMKGNSSEITRTREAWLLQ